MSDFNDAYTKIALQELQAQQMRVDSNGLYQAPKRSFDPLRNPVTGRVTPRAMLEIRLGYHSTDYSAVTQPAFRICAVEQLPETVVVFAVVNDKPVMLEDERAMFPSDKLISKIRLLTP
jgi:hypothetical protein